MPLEVDLKNFKYVTLNCSECRSSIRAPIAKRGGSNVSDAIEKVSKEAKRQRWSRDPDICPKH